jgi:GMP synthase (glutamine-hydrolysing)
MTSSARRSGLVGDDKEPQRIQPAGVKPVLVLQNLSADGPAYLGGWLRAHGIAHEVLDSEAGDRWPVSVDGYCAIAVLGGAMSANDDLPSLRHAESLILQAMKRDVPVIGHCLGGQLMARALGAAVAPSPAPEIGWQPIDVLDCAQARAWFGHASSQTVLQWHYEAFDLPDGAQLLARSAACPHQAFAIGPHLALQFHLEIDDEKLRVWAADQSGPWREAQRAHASVQDGPTMLEQSAVHMAANQRLADRIYQRWLGSSCWAGRVNSAS